MRSAGRIVHEALRLGARNAVAGVSTAEIAEVIAESIARADAEAIFMSYSLPERDRGARDREGVGFPDCACISVNEEVVHGVPGERRLLEGDLVSIDCGVRLNGWCADAAITVAVGEVSQISRHLLQSGESLLHVALAEIRPGRLWSDVAIEIERAARSSGVQLVRDYVGHGIGQALHESPEVPCTTPVSKDFTIRPGMTLAIEPIAVLGAPRTRLTADGWTVVTVDGLPSSHFEHTIAVTRDGADVLTDGR